MRARLLSLAILALAVVAGVGQATTTGAVDVIPAGQDPLETAAPARYDPGTVPADFFDPGSDPFTGTINFQGAPIGGPLGTTDTIIQRMAPANVPAPYPSVDTVPIELVSLSLVSIAPITVTYFGGFSPELWDVQLVKSNVAPSTGSMTITKQHPNGGVFTTSLTIQPRFIFTRIGPPATRIIEPPDVGPYMTNSPPTVWEETCTLPNSVQATSFCWGADPLPQRIGKLLQSPSSNHSLYHACTDNDLDGVPDCVDNCPNNFNPLQEDNDGDGTGNVCDPTPDGDVSPGFIYLESVDPTNYDPGTVPADFFDPGSDPFTGTIVYSGDPLGPYGMADTRIERLGPANLPAPYPSVDTIPIELVQLSLTSSSPITVTYFGGFTPELWDVHLERSNLAPSQGTMTITKTHPNGGTFTADFNVAPRFIFTRQSDSSTRILEVPDVPPYTKSSGPIPWSQPCSPPYVSDTDFCLVFHEFGHSIQDAQVPNFSTQTVRQACVDADGDGVSDCIDNCPTVSNAAQTNSDADSFGDACDNCTFVSNAAQTNSDADSFGNACDNCPTVTNATQADGDGDGLGDACDNCPTVSNANQANQDGDEYGDACEQPNCVTVINHWTVGPGDTDCDGYTDTTTFAPRAPESAIGTVPTAKCSATPAIGDEPLPDAWPPDFNDNQLVNISDYLSYNSVFGQPTTNPPVIYLGQSVPVGRWDLNASGLINVSDVLQLNPFMFKRCSP